jgi:hypothetical protein
MKMSISKEKASISNDKLKITDVEKNFNLNEFIEDMILIEPESKIETHDEEDSCYEREERLNDRDSGQIKSIQTIETKNYKFIGEVNGFNKKDGIGVCYYNNGDKYIGQFKNGKKNGIGKFILTNGEVFQGEFTNDSIEGFMEHIGKNATKQGYAKKFKFISGAIQLSSDNNNFSIEGNLDVDNENIGIGKITNTKKKCSYSGEISNFLPNGYGLSIIMDKFIYQGQHINGKFTGYGEIFFSDGSLFFGFFNNCLRNGISLAYCKFGRLSFGKYDNDIRTGPFIESDKSVLNLIIWNNGFKSKLLEKMDAAVTYLNNFYPEFRWISRINLKRISDIYKDIHNNNSKIPKPPQIVFKKKDERLKKDSKNIIKIEDKEKFKVQLNKKLSNMFDKVKNDEKSNDIEEFD